MRGSYLIPPHIYESDRPYPLPIALRCRRCGRLPNLLLQTLQKNPDAALPLRIVRGQMHPACRDRVDSFLCRFVDQIRKLPSCGAPGLRGTQVLRARSTILSDMAMQADRSRSRRQSVQYIADVDGRPLPTAHGWYTTRLERSRNGALTEDAS
jgi:hypothetical protein